MKSARTKYLNVALLVIACVGVVASTSKAEESVMQMDGNSATAQGSMGGLSKLSLDKAWPSPVDDQERQSYFLADLLEHRWTRDQDLLRWDVFGWYGGDYNRIWFKSEGRQVTAAGSGGYAEAQLLYGRLISPFLDLQAGIRRDQLWANDSGSPSRSFAVLGLQGLVPYRFDIEPTLYLSDDGDVSARATAVYDMYLSQRLILQPRLEGNAASRGREKFGVGAGLNDVEIGLRLRYEIRREFAPYLGISWGRSYGDSAEYLRRQSEDVDVFALIAGIRMWL